MSTDTSSTAALDSLTDVINAYRYAKDKAAEWNETAETFRANIVAHLDEHNAEIGTVDGAPAVKYTRVTSRRLDTKALRHDHPDLANGYMTETTTRRFTVVEP